MERFDEEFGYYNLTLRELSEQGAAASMCFLFLVPNVAAWLQMGTCMQALLQERAAAVCAGPALRCLRGAAQHRIQDLQIQPKQFCCMQG